MNTRQSRPSQREEVQMSFSHFKVLTFDVVGTLIDFEAGVLNAVRKLSGKTPADLSDDRIFAAYKRGRDAHPERSSEVMFNVYKYLARELELPASDTTCDAFQLAVLRWQPFSDSAEALKRLRTKFRLVAMTNADRVAILKDGKLVQIDQPKRLHDAPVNSFVASFIGEASLLPVRRVDSSSVALGSTILRSTRTIPNEDALMLAVHSEKLLIDDGSCDPVSNRLAGTVTDVVYQGESLRVFLALEDGTQLSLRQPSHHDAYRRIPPPGDTITVVLHPEDTIVVPKAAE